MNKLNNKNLILGIIKGYDFEKIKPFVISLKKTGYKGDLCLFYSEINKKTCNILLQYGIRLIPFENGFSFIKNVVNINNNLSLQNYNRISICFLRDILYYTYLQKHRRNYSNVMLTDVRDVIFQRDPFDFKYKKGLNCFLEDKRMKINTSPINSRWMVKAFDENILKEIGNNYISCAGIVIGSISDILNYLKKMLLYINQKNINECMDQAIHNYLIYSNQIEDIELFENENGPVLTLGYKKKETIRFNEEYLILNNNGYVVNVLHQYNRHLELTERLYKKYHIKFFPREKVLTRLLNFGRDSEYMERFGIHGINKIIEFLERFGIKGAIRNKLLKKFKIHGY